MMLSGAEGRVEVVAPALVDGQNLRGHAVGDVDIFNILADIAPLQVVVVQIGGGHDDNVRVHLHEQGDGLLLPNIIGTNLRMSLCDLEDLILRVVGHVMHRHIGVRHDVINDVLEIFVEAALFRVEHQMLVLDGEEALVVRLLPAGVFLCGGGMTVGLKRLDLMQTLAAGLQRFIVHIFLRINHAVQHGGLQDGKQVADNPIQRHAQRHEPAQIQAQSDGERHGAIFVQQSLLALQHVLAVLVQAQKP